MTVARRRARTRPGRRHRAPPRRPRPARRPHRAGSNPAACGSDPIQRATYEAGLLRVAPPDDTPERATEEALLHHIQCRPYVRRPRRPIASRQWRASSPATTCRSCASSRTARCRWSTPTRRSTPAARRRGGRWRRWRPRDGDRTGFGGRRYATHAAQRVLVPRQLRRLPRVPRAAPARAAPRAGARGDAVPAPGLPRGALRQAAARRALRPRVLPQRADLGLRLRRQAAPPLAAEARHDPRLRARPASATCSTPRRSTASRTWRPASSRPSSASAASGRPASCGTRSSPPPAARRPATRRRSRRRSCGASSRPPPAPGDLCLDPFAGSGTLGAVAAALGRRYLLIDESPEAVEVMRARLGDG